MRMLLFIATLATLQIFIDASHPFYYFGQPNFYQHAPPVPTFNSFSHPYTSTFFGNPHYIYRNVPTPIIPQSRIPVPTPPAPIMHHHYVPPKTDYSQSQQEGEYSGFAYQTRTDHGATSHVLFVTGPQSEMFKSAILPPKRQDFMINENQNKDMSNVKMVNTVKEKDPQPNFYNIAPQPVPQDPSQFFQDFLKQNQIPRTVHFYSRNSKLFAQPAIGYPANTGPLLQATESQYAKPFVNPRFNPSTTTEIPMTMTTIKFNVKSDNEVAEESIISQTRFRLNQITENPQPFTPQTTEEITPSNFDIETLPFGSRLRARIIENLREKEAETTEQTKTTFSSLGTQSTESTTPEIIETTFVNTPKIVLVARNFPAVETTVSNLSTMETEATTADSLASETASSITIANSPVSETTSITANTPEMETASSSTIITTVASETTLPTISIETTLPTISIETTSASRIETTSASRIETTVANSPAIETTAAINANPEDNETTSTENNVNTGNSDSETVSTVGSISTKTMTETTAKTQEEMTEVPFTSAVTMTTENTTTKK